MKMKPKKTDDQEPKHHSKWGADGHHRWRYKQETALLKRMTQKKALETVTRLKSAGDGGAWHTHTHYRQVISDHYANTTQGGNTRPTQTYGRDTLKLNRCPKQGLVNRDYEKN